ncbi:MAG: hypothetical protein ACAH80_15700 [Alphaproteobacteria bacterium]
MKPVPPDKNLINRAFGLKPLLRDQSGQMHFTDAVDLYENFHQIEVYSQASANHLKEFERVEVLIPATLVRGLVFSPTQAQVLPQVPEELLAKATGFRLQLEDDHNGQNGYVRGEMILYSGDMPEKIKKQEVIAWRKHYTEPFPPEEKPKPVFNTVAATTLGEDVHVRRPLEIKKPATMTPGL